MKYLKKALCLLTVLFLTGCATHSANLYDGTSMTYASLSDQRAAIREVKEFDSLPAGAIVLGVVDTARCHRKSHRDKPTRETVIIDLKVAAYAKGAEGITNISVNKMSALSRNCWFILDGDATMFTLAK